MIAHIKYLDLDKEKCATYSEPIISFIKNNLGFEGILFSDDLCMKALKGHIFIEQEMLLRQVVILFFIVIRISNLKSCEGAGYASMRLIEIESAENT